MLQGAPRRKQQELGSYLLHLWTAGLKILTGRQRAGSRRWRRALSFLCFSQWDGLAHKCLVRLGAGAELRQPQEAEPAAGFPGACCSAAWWRCSPTKLLLNAGNGTWRSQSLLHLNSSPNKGVREVKKMSIESIFRSSFILFLPHRGAVMLGAGAGICSALILAVRGGFPAAHWVTHVKRSLSTPS